MSKKVLIVDDNSDNIYMLESLLKEYGHEVTSAENGQDALDKARLNPPDLLVTDILMPVMDGYALCRQWKSDDTLKHIPLVFYTAEYAGSANEDFALSLGADRFILKPQEPDALMDLLNGVLGERYAARPVATRPLGEEMEFFRQHNEILFKKLEKKMLDLEIVNQELEISEEKLRESEELFRCYLEYAPDGVYMSDVEGNFLYGNRKCEEMIGYRQEELIGKNFLELNLLTENSLAKAVELLQANREGKSTGPDEIDLIAKDGRLIPVEINTNVVQRMGQKIVLAFVRDITERRRAEQKLKDTLESLRKAFGTTVQVMVSAVEIRDPYTAGHQVRVADLARAIATEKGLTRDRIDGLRMAALIHDIGKLSIPAEILSKPTKLTEIEFSLIKEHSLKGYEMLKDVESPWPLAQIVYQHHERMNGSGYPRNLRGEEILMEARILAVADVVESMANHRPYRPSLGVHVALDEIAKNRGLLYNMGVVNACLKIFNEKGYRMAV
jgi:PAS domain S-box-containing protein/putative nucleotidyltransferase with HDIG domain